MKSLSHLQFSRPYPIQQKAIPPILARRDVLGIAATGSGKTAAFILPIFSRLESLPPLKNRHVEVLILSPTRELATQIQEFCLSLGKGFTEPIKSRAVFGGVSINPQMKGMMGVRVLIATPGRLLELVESGAVHLGQVRTLVLDEADKLLNMGFQDEMKAILDLLPKQRQSLLFSATLNPDIKDLQGAVLNHPERIEIEAKANTIDLISQQAYSISPENKGPFLRSLILKEEMQQVLIFTSSKRRADHVAEKLTKNGIQAIAVHGDKSMGHRQKALADFKAGKLKVLVTTDLLSRGIDIEFLPFVINYELPRSPKDYIHRIGRTGRAEHPGKAISLITPEEEAHFKVIQKKMKKRVDLEDGDARLGI